MRRTTASLYTFALTAAALLSACMAEPYDGEVIASHPTTIIPRISGYGNSTGLAVEVQAKNASGGFDVITTTTTGGTRWTWAGDSWYAWDVHDLDLPAAYWTDKPGGCGQKATLRSKVGNNFGYTFDEPFVTCWDPFLTATEFWDACGSDNTPEVTIETCGALCC